MITLAVVPIIALVKRLVKRVLRFFDIPCWECKKTGPYLLMCWDCYNHAHKDQWEKLSDR